MIILSRIPSHTFRLPVELLTGLGRHTGRQRLFVERDDMG